MTKQKKFKRRVRARMEETGERYTDAKTAEENPSMEKLLDRLLEARTQQNAGKIAYLVRKFALANRQDRQQATSVLIAEVIEVLWPDKQAVTLKQMRAQLRETIGLWKVGGSFEGTAVLTKEQRSPGFEEALASYRRNLTPGGLSILTGPSGRTLVALADDEEMEELPPRERLDPLFDAAELAEAGTPEGDEQLASLWKHAPDVTEAFFPVAHAPVDMRTIREMAQELLEVSKQVDQAKVERRITTSRLEPWNILPDVADQFRVPLATRKIKVGEEEFETLHGGEADELIRYAQEIQRLREKLNEAGIDPDA